MNLVSASKSLITKVEHLSESEARGQTIRSIQPIEDGLNEATERFTAICSIVKHFSQESSIDFSRIDYSFASVRKKFTPVRKSLEGNPIEALQRNRWANCHSSLDTAARELENGLKKTWKGYVDQMSHDIKSLEPFLELGEGARAIREIKAKQVRLTALGENMPPEDIDSCIKTVKSLSEEISEKISTLDLGELPEGVVSFIKKVKSFNGATLADLEAEVFEWLKSKDMLKNFTVK
jgi:hypothetical protein